MDSLESKIVEILKRGTPIRAVKIPEMLGVERREVNHYLYSSLKNMVSQLRSSSTYQSTPTIPQNR